MENITASEIAGMGVGALLFCATVAAPKIDSLISASQRRSCNPKSTGIAPFSWNKSTGLDIHLRCIFLVMSTSNSSVSSGSSSHASDDNYRNPFYLHPSDNHGNVLVSTLLHGDNYHTWSTAMYMALMVTNKLGFVDGSVTQTDASSQNHGSWSCCNMMVLSWLFNAISKDLRDGII